jgi:hypothetical protein
MLINTGPLMNRYVEFLIKTYKKERNRIANKKIISNKIDEKIPDLVVKNGPFKGMQYPEKNSIGSALFPKLLGSYESELHKIIDLCIDKKYTDIVDIGCAEGYYAVGMAIRLSNANIYAYDTDPQALSLTSSMFKINNINQNRIFIGNLCDEKTLMSIPLKEKALIISDCEGYEKHLFTEKSVEFLSNHDLLIEVHDMFDIEISSYLSELFKDTHKLYTIYSIDDIQKAKTYNYDEINDCNLPTKKILLEEGRESIMEWFYLESVNNK